MNGRTEVFTIEKSAPAQRLDTFLRSRFPAASRGTLRRLIEQGHITVNGGPAKPAQAPRAGDEVSVYWPEARPAVAQPEAMTLDILHEDDCLLVLNKPPGLVVHPGAGHEDHTLVNALLHHCRGQLSGIGGVARPGIVHRLDKDTSGVMVVAKTDESHVALSEQFARRGVTKVYHALVCGVLARPSGEIRAAIARHPGHRKRMAVSPGDGREAWTSYRVVERLLAATCVQAGLHTGRTHQIRVHFQHLGHPLVGDPVYGSRQNRLLAELTGYIAPRIMLHAGELAFIHPHTRRTMRWVAALPEDFCAALDALRLRG